jgi:ABC-2 type transport system permease protein
MRLWRLYAVMDVLYLARGVQVALTYYLADLVIGLSAFTATFLLAQRFDGIGQWTRPQVLFLLGFALLVRTIVNSLFNYNMAQFSRRIGRGQLDHLLIQPQPLWMACLTEGFAPLSGSGMLVPSLLLLGIAWRQLGMSFDVGWLALVLLQLVASVAIMVAFEYAWAAAAFWAPRAAEEVNSSTWQLLNQLAPFPLDGVPAGLLLGLVTLVPAGLIAWYPSRVLLGMSVPALAGLIVPMAALVMWGITWWIFRAGMRQYGRTGSTRYLSWGHRQ